MQAMARDTRFAYSPKQTEDAVRKAYADRRHLLDQRPVLFHWAFLVAEALEQVALARLVALAAFDRLRSAAADHPETSPELEARIGRFRHIEIELPRSRELLLRLPNGWPDEKAGRTIEYQLSGVHGVRGRCLNFRDAPELYAAKPLGSMDAARTEAVATVGHAVRLLCVHQDQLDGWLAGPR